MRWNKKNLVLFTDKRNRVTYNRLYSRPLAEEFALFVLDVPEVCFLWRVRNHNLCLTTQALPPVFPVANKCFYFSVIQSPDLPHGLVYRITVPVILRVVIDLPHSMCLFVESLQ